MSGWPRTLSHVPCYLLLSSHMSVCFVNQLCLKVTVCFFVKTVVDPDHSVSVQLCLFMLQHILKNHLYSVKERNPLVGACYTASPSQLQYIFLIRITESGKETGSFNRKKPPVEAGTYWKVERDQSKLWKVTACQQLSEDSGTSSSHSEDLDEGRQCINARETQLSLAPFNIIITDCAVKAYNYNLGCISLNYCFIKLLTFQSD